MTFSTSKTWPEPAEIIIPPYPFDLPILERRAEIVAAIRKHQVLVITGETGSGKSTQIPKFCMEAGQGTSGMIGCTQPRRIAAITLAARVCEEFGPRGPALVGYKIRFADHTARTTTIKFMTDGVLLAEAQRDRNFRAYDTIIVDEAHERTLNIDFLIGILRQTLSRRADLKVVITSATIDPEKFSSAFGGAPIIEVSGRMFPVEVLHIPPDKEMPQEGTEAGYIDQALQAVDLLRPDSQGRGDILIFMPTESDILETVQRIEGKSFPNTIVMPLFGRMAASDQQRVFAATTRRKIIVATNIAETSVTIPGIRYVIDTGLARTSRYNPRSKTRSLPVAPISRASADQRKGRCGRVEAGVCIRLYSEEDYSDRPLYTPPEILRSNLAEVILRMLHLRLGKVQDFSFLDPPSSAAVKDGFAVLRELGAVDDHQRLTRAGKMMARMPLDPRIARMLIEAREEKALREIMIIGSALSIQDPRERPLDQEAAARQAQAVFKDTRSDFVSILKIWQACWEQPESGTARHLKKFCRDHFMSFRRLREWRDIFLEIRSILAEIGGFEENAHPAGYDGVHRAILAGYLSQVAVRKEKNLYTAARGSQAMLFPGSTVFGRGGTWIVTSELVQTTRLFARTAANIDPEWIEKVGRHVLKYSWSEPHWEKNRGQVTAFEKATAYGLTVFERRKVNFERIDPEQAREIFIRSALVQGDLPPRYGFLDHNSALLSQIEELENKTRRRGLLADEQALYDFYDARLPQLCDIRSFDKLLKDKGGDDFLKMKKEELLQNQPATEAAEQFPDALGTTGAELPLRYAFSPGEIDDGVTLRVPVHTLPSLRPQAFEWLVPGMVAEKVSILLKSLPKEVRKRLAPIGETVREISAALSFGDGDFHTRLCEAVFNRTGIRLAPAQWGQAQLPEHLRMRFEVLDPSGNVLASGRDIEDLRTSAIEKHEDRLWKEAQKKLEHDEVAGLDFGELPRRVEIGTDAMGIPRFAWPGLADENGLAALRLFADPQSAAESSQAGLLLLYKKAFAAELAQFKKSWAFPDTFAARVFFMGGIKNGSLALYDYILQKIFGLDLKVHPDRKIFLENLEKLRGRLGIRGQELREPVLKAVEQRHATMGVIERFRRMAAHNRAVSDRLAAVRRELEALIPPDFLNTFSEQRVGGLVRYAKGLAIRAERAYVYPEKDSAKEAQVMVYAGRLEDIGSRLLQRPTPEGLGFLQEASQMIEEFKISLFAPEIKTLFPVSEKRIEKKLSGFAK